jgi:hypothetical protein
MLLHTLHPDTLTGDNGYANARRIRAWAKDGVALLTPAYKWVNPGTGVKGSYAVAYHRFIRRPENAALLDDRPTAIEPFFDLLALIVGATSFQKNCPFSVLLMCVPAWLLVFSPSSLP